MKRIFLEKYFPASRAANIRKEIYGIKQYTGKSLHEYWERFKKLCASYPQHHISENQLIQLFNEGLLSHDRNMLDAASGGVFVDKIPVQTRNLIENMAANSHQFGTNRSDHAPRRGNEETRTVVNPRENVRAITLRSGKELKVNEEVVKEPVQNEYEEKSKVEEDELIQEAPRALKESRKDEGIKGLYEVFRRYEVNIPLLDDIKQVPRYAKYLKKMCIVKRKQKLKGCQKVELGEQVSAVIQRKAPEKCKDPGPLNKIEIVIQMADRSTINPRGVIKDVFVQVGDLVFPADFYFDGEIVKFHIFYTLKIPGCESIVNNIEINDHLSQEHTKDVPKTEPKLPSDRSKGIPKKSMKRKHGTKLTGKFLR
ncbi:uncharacterized protein [Henckelia pumila]|uniref:uncharacterized protein n=1 Tax=Henckelia pumila TaxID=405737 RepID=UPI003C6E1E95